MKAKRSFSTATGHIAIMLPGIVRALYAIHWMKIGASANSSTVRFSVG
jgi:hypothetical protein